MLEEEEVGATVERSLSTSFDLPRAAFVLLAAGKKYPPIEKGWEGKPHSFQEAADHASRGGNVAILAGHSGLGTFDLDKLHAFADIELPPTLAWQTRPGRRAMVFRWSDDPAKVLAGLNKKSDLAQIHLYKNGEHVGEIKIGKSYQVIPPSWKTLESGERADYILLEPSAPADIPLAWLLSELQKLGITFSQKAESQLDANAARLEGMAGEARRERAESDEVRTRRYAEAALAGEVEAVRSAPVGDRNNCLNVAACKMGGWISAGVLTASEVEGALALAAMDAGLEPSEIAATIRSGLEAGMRSPREIPESTKTDYLHDLPLTEGGNASRLVKLHGQNIRYVHDRHKWLIWNGAKWEFDSNGRILRLAEDVVRDLYEQAAMADNKDDRARYSAFAEVSDRNFHLKNVLGIASCRERIAITSSALDRDRWLMGAGRLVIEAKTGMVREAGREDLITKRLGTEHQPGMTCPMWEAFLARIFDGDQALIAYVKRAAGYSLTGSMDEQVFFFCHGTGHNGKSVFLETLRSLAGDYGAAASFETFLIQRNQGIRNDLAALAGKRFVAAKESEEGSKFAMSVLKSWTGGDEVTARFLHEEYFSFHPEGKIWLAANSKPTISERNLAAWRRVHLVPFNVTIPAAEQDKGLTDKLKAELPGILNWALEGLAEYLEIGLKPPEAVKAATDQYRRENDSIQAFIGECCQADRLASCRNADLYPAYVRFCNDSGHLPLTQTAFSRELESAPGISKKHTERGRVWRGIALTYHGRAEGPEGSEGQNDIILLKKPREEKIADLPSDLSGPSVIRPLGDDLGQTKPFSQASPGRQEGGKTPDDSCSFCGHSLKGGQVVGVDLPICAICAPGWRSVKTIVNGKIAEGHQVSADAVRYEIESRGGRSPPRANLELMIARARVEAAA